MDNFIIRFLICNVFISGMIVILLLAKWIFKNNLSSRMQYNLWFLLIGLMAIPFIPLRLVGFPQIISLFSGFWESSASDASITVGETAEINQIGSKGWMNDFTLSVNSGTPSIARYILLWIWIVGILAMVILLIKSSLRLFTLKKSALPLQNPDVRKLYLRCMEETEINRNIPIYSTAFLKSPIIVGLLRPCIYLPIHLISDYNESDMRYILLHELQHYKHHDAIGSFLMNIAGVTYWFNPLVWYALREMRNDREIACDTSVLKMLDEDDYSDYGNTLINFAEKVSLTPFPYAAGLGGNIKQMKRRIINIATYKKPSLTKRVKGSLAFMLTVLILIGFTPFISTYAADGNYYDWNHSSLNVSYVDLSTYFGEYEGSFVLYDLDNDSWRIHDMERATLRVAPNSTYKLYDALFGLEEGIITPKDSFIAWNGKEYPFEAWNADQTLQTAMASSVNWYFQSVDEQLGTTSVYNYVKNIKYGNENISGDFSSYWMESSLKISPIEQVELLIKLQKYSLGFSSENIDAVKDAICLLSSDTGTFYGKTGTGRVNGQDVNGWFIGFIEASGNTYFFATNIESDSNATGSSAAEITKSILSDMNIWK